LQVLVGGQSRDPECLSTDLARRAELNGMDRKEMEKVLCFVNLKHKLFLIQPSIIGTKNI
jgi:hypothetical protein